MYIVVNSLKRNLGFKGIEINDLLIGVPIIFTFLFLFVFSPYKIESIIFLMVGIFMLLPIRLSKKNRMYKVIILLITFLFRNKTYIYTKEKEKGRVINFGNK